LHTTAIVLTILKAEKLPNTLTILEKNYDYLKKTCMKLGFGSSMESGKQSKSFEMPKGGEK